jgi:hypothetical protein
MVRATPPSSFSVPRPQMVQSAQPRALSPASVRAPIAGRDVASDIRSRLNTVLGRIPGYMAHADQIAMPLTAVEQQMIANAPPEMQGQLRAQLQREHEALARQLRGDASSVGRTFSPTETQAQMRQATQALKGSVNQTFNTFARQADRLPPEQRAKVLNAIQSERANLFKEIDANAARMGSNGASFQDVVLGRQRIEQALSRSTGDLRAQILSLVPPEQQALVRAQLEMQRMEQTHAQYNLFDRALQPSSPFEFNQLPGGAPPMTGPLTQAQATQLLRQLENGIQQQAQARVQQANTLPPEMRQQAMFEAQVQRDRMLVNAYRNVLSRVTAPTL